MNESAIFKAAVKLAPDQRQSFVAAACVGHPQLREDVEALLHEHDEAGSFIQFDGNTTAASGSLSSTAVLRRILLARC